MSTRQIESDREVKGLRSQIAAKRGDLAAANVAAASAQRQASNLGRDILAIEARIKELEQPVEAGPIIVTEHALLRYLERVYGIDLDGVRGEIIAGAESTIRFMRDGQIQRPEGHTLVIKNMTVVTVKGGGV